MKNLTTPKAILFGFGLVALAIASVPYSSAGNGVQKVEICSSDGIDCVDLWMLNAIMHEYVKTKDRT